MALVLAFSSGARADDFDFDLLAEPELVPVLEQGPDLLKTLPSEELVRRRTMLQLHQAVGIGLVVGELGSIISGQLNYNDKFVDGNSARYRLTHQIFTYSTVGLALGSAGLSLFAPVPIEKRGGFDRMTLHKIGMFTAFAGWAAQVGLGLYTSSREGYEDQKTLAQAHLAVGYLTLAGTMLGLGSVVF